MQQLQGFSAALKSGRIDLSQFGLDPKGYGIVDVLEAVLALVDSEVSSKPADADDSAAMDS